LIRNEVCEPLRVLADWDARGTVGSLNEEGKKDRLDLIQKSQMSARDQKTVHQSSMLEQDADELGLLIINDMTSITILFSFIFKPAIN
jgi:hypothetical protein